MLGASPAQLRAYTKAALVGISGDLEHGAAMIHPRLGMAMRRAIKRGRVIIPGHAKVGPPGTTVDLIYGPIDEGWDLDAFDSTPVLIHDAPRPQEIVLWIGYATGPRVNARCKGPDQKEVDALVASFANSQWINFNGADRRADRIALDNIRYWPKADNFLTESNVRAGKRRKTTCRLSQASTNSA